MTTRESARARTNFCHLGDVGKKESGRSSIFLGSVVRSVSDFLTLLARRARASQPLLLPLRHPVSPHFTPRARRRRRRRGRRPWTSPARLRRSLPLRRRRFLWRRRSSRARPPRPPRPPRLPCEGRRGAPWTCAPSGPVTLMAFVRESSLFSTSNSTGSSCGEKRRSGWMGTEIWFRQGSVRSQGSVRLLTRRATEGRSRRKAPAGTFRRSTAAGRGEKGGMRGGVGRPHGARAREARAGGSRGGAMAARARAARDAAGRNAW